MKMLTLLLAVLIFSIRVVISDFDDFSFRESSIENKNSWIYMPDGNGKPRIVYLNHDQLNNNKISKISSILEENINVKVTYSLYTRNNVFLPTEIYLHNKILSQNSHFDFTKDIKILVHGWKANNQSDFNQKLKDKYLQKKDCNVLIVDWSSVADLSYITAAWNTNNVAEKISNFIHFLIENGFKWSQLHLIGHSLGAHICGGVGLYLQGRIQRITGLDPAAPLFNSIVSAGNVLSSANANFVDVIHTCGGSLGFDTSIGTVDFYPNGGVNGQPGCAGEIYWIESCSHSRAWEYFEESIGNKKAFPSTQCESWEKFKQNDCQSDVKVSMGEETSLRAKGNFYLVTSEVSPYNAIYTT